MRITVLFWRLLSGEGLIWRAHINTRIVITVFSLIYILQFIVLFQPTLRIKVSTIERYCVRNKILKIPAFTFH